MTSWTRADRLLLLGLVLAYIPGTPGLGIDTRDTGDSGALLGTVYGVAFLLPIVALAASWKWPRVATWSALTGGVLAVVLPLLDLASILGPPPPSLMIVVDLVVATLGVAVLWRRRRAMRGVSAGV